MATGKDFALAGLRRTMLESSRPVIAVSAVRTGCGKSQTARWLSRWLWEKGFKVAAIRRPMPYGERIGNRDDQRRPAPAVGAIR